MSSASTNARPTSPTNALSIDLPAFGVALRGYRQQLNWTRRELAEAMPSKPHVQTLADYEHGRRQCTVAKLVEILSAMGLDAAEAAAEVIAAAVAAVGRPDPCPTCRGSGRHAAVSGGDDQ